MLSLAPGPHLHAQQTSGEQSLQRRQQRDAAIRQQDIREQQRQRAAQQQQSQTDNPVLLHQLKSANQAEHQRYIERRREEATKYPDLPPATQPPASYPSPSSSAHKASSGGPAPSSSAHPAPSPARSG